MVIAAVFVRKSLRKEAVEQTVSKELVDRFAKVSSKIKFAAIPLVFLSFWGAAFWVLRVDPLIKELRCVMNMTTIRRATYDLKGDIVFDSNFLSNLNFDEKTLTCPSCGKRYIYNPVPASGNRVQYGDANSFILWCPESCHRDRRVFLDGDLYTVIEDDDEICWYFQKFIKRLINKNFN
ncbi:MAG: hypothetical protein ISS77_06460 [Phycisphaerae bacterium]|nr:hypothetical protein [Phycisphaerae bacterium]